MVTLIIGDRVRVKATGEIMVVEDANKKADKLLLTQYGHMAGGLAIHSETYEFRRDEVTKVVGIVEWVDADD